MLFLLLSLLLLTNVNCKINSTGQHGNKITNWLKKASDSYTFFKSPLGASLLLHELERRNISSKCIEDFKAFATGLTKGQRWAMEMFDAYGKIGSGISEGNLMWPGRYSLCKNVVQEVISNNTDVGNAKLFHGQFCWVTIKPTEKITQSYLHTNHSTSRLNLKVAVCIPDSCSSDDLSSLLGIINDIKKIKEYVVMSSHCDSYPNIWKDTAAVIAIMFCLLMLTIILIGTSYDIHLRSSSSAVKHGKNSQSLVNGLSPFEIESEELLQIQENTVELKKNAGISGKILLCFSILTNGAKLFNCHSQMDSLKCLDGIRVLATLTIIYGHVIFALTIQNSNDIKVGLDAFVNNLYNFAIIVTAHVSVDTFLVLSGLFVTYSHFNQLETRNESLLWIPKFYLHRYLRLTPAYAVVLIIFATTLFPYYSNSPLWRKNVHSDCVGYWWEHLTYTNNLKIHLNDCLPQSWYLAADMQFQIISPLILIFLHRYRIIAAVIAGCIILTNWIAFGSFVTYHNLRLSFGNISSSTTVNPSDFSMYTKPYCRMAPFVIGIACGYLLVKSKFEATINKKLVILGWLSTAGLSSSVLFGIYHADLSQTMSSLFVALAGTAWSLAVTWVIFACCNGFGGLVNSFLSFSFWKPLGRLSYSAFLLQKITISLYFFNSDENEHYTPFLIISSFIPITIYTYFASIFIYLSIEAPFMELTKFFKL